MLWLSAFSFFLSFLLLLSALPIFARRLGASDAAVGFIMASFAVSSLALRPPTGWAADRFGRRPFMLAGALVFVVASLAYGWASGALGLVLVRFLHGCGMGLYPTAASAWSRISRRRIAAARSSASSAPPAVSRWPRGRSPASARRAARLRAAFWIAGAVATVALAPDRRHAARRCRARDGWRSPRPHVQPRALVPSLVIGCLMLTYGALVTFLPLHAAAARAEPRRLLPRLRAVAHHGARAGGPDLRSLRPVRRSLPADSGWRRVALLVLALQAGRARAGSGRRALRLAGGIAQPALMAWCVDVVARRPIAVARWERSSPRSSRHRNRRHVRGLSRSAAGDSWRRSWPPAGVAWPAPSPAWPARQRPRPA